MMRRLTIVAISFLLVLMVVSTIEQVSAQGSKKTPTPVRTHTPNTETPVPTSDSANYNNIAQGFTEDGTPILGSPKAKIIIVAFIDFSCPHCLNYRPTLNEIVDKIVRTRKARLVYRLQTFVGADKSVLVSQAALCAGDQGHFWEMQDAIFNLARDHGIEGFGKGNMQELAARLKLDLEPFDMCLEDGSTDAVLEFSKSFAEQNDLQGVPALMVSIDDGKTFQWFKDTHGNELKGGNVSLAEIDRNIDQLLKAE